MDSCSEFVSPRKKQVAIAAAAICTFVPLDALATRLVVGNCLDDNSAPSLRSVIASAHDNDNIDVGMLTCSTITLTQGQLEIPQAHLGVYRKYHKGFESTTTISSSYTLPFSPPHRIFHHTGGGDFALTDVILHTGGAFYPFDPALGGCIYSNGSVELTNATLSNCFADGAPANGGAVFAMEDITVSNSTISTNGANAGTNSGGAGGALFSSKGSITITKSSITNNYLATDFPSYGGAVAAFAGKVTGTDCVISGNRVQSTTHGARGGAIVAAAGVDLTRCTVSGNSATGMGTDFQGRAGGGGIYAGGNSTIRDSTIDHNSAYYGGGFYIANSGALTITNSTVASNTASNAAGAIRTTGAITLNNSTIAFNHAPIGAGVFVDTSKENVPIVLQSSILADNQTTDNSVAADLLVGGTQFTLAANNDLIVASSIPIANAIGSCPRLQPLAANGGPTQTLALMHDSPAIDVGNNASALTDDQRGSSYPRVFGAATDIGAYEWQGVLDDRVFHSGFESGCDE